MNIFAAFALVALGIALAETYGAIRLRAERAAYERGYKQAHRENEIRDDAIDEYAITTPRKLTDYEANDLQYKTSRTAGMVWRPVEEGKPAPIGQSFMDHMQANGQATMQLGKEV